MKLVAGYKVCLGFIIILLFSSCTKEFENFTPNAIIGSIDDFFSFYQAPQNELQIDTRVIDSKVFPLGVRTYVGLKKELFKPSK